MAGQTDDARISVPEHLDGRAASQPELFELVDMVRMAKNLGNASATANGKLLQRDGLAVCWLFHRSTRGGCCGYTSMRLTLILTRLYAASLGTASAAKVRRRGCEKSYGAFTSIAAQTTADLLPL